MIAGRSVAAFEVPNLGNRCPPWEWSVLEVLYILECMTSAGLFILGEEHGGLLGRLGAEAVARAAEPTYYGAVEYVRRERKGCPRSIDDFCC